MEEILDDTQEVRDDDVEEEELSIDEVDDESDESFTPTSSALLSPMSKEQIFSGYDDDLPKKNFLDGRRISVGYRHVAKISALLWSRDSCFALHMANQSGESSMTVFLLYSFIIDA